MEENKEKIQDKYKKEIQEKFNVLTQEYLNKYKGTDFNKLLKQNSEKRLKKQEDKKQKVTPKDIPDIINKLKDVEAILEVLVNKQINDLVDSASNMTHTILIQHFNDNIVGKKDISIKEIEDIIEKL